ncbi:MAG: phospholipase D family protein [Desulfomonilia bacterium]|jgi:phosphatidylserine/phosphatidylglycerophosphate/cardiolipin synthase-like enzyme
MMKLGKMKSESCTQQKLIAYSLLFLVFFYIMPLSQAQAEEFKSVGTTDVYFSPKGGCTEAIVQEINHAKKEILVQAYSFTSKPIAKALLDAHKRGVKVEVILDKSQRSEKYSSADFMAHAGITTYIDTAHAIAHNKIMCLDRDTLISGSFNFTKAAEEKNAENLLIIKGNKPLTERYIKNYLEHRAHSDLYAGR